MRNLLVVLPAILLLQAPQTNTQAPVATSPPAITTDEQKTVYAIGLSMYRSLPQFALSPAEVELVKRGLADAAAGKPLVDVNTWEPKIEELVNARAPVVAARDKAAAKAYTEKAAAAAGAVTTPTGLVYRETTAGTGSSPKASDVVKVHYRGTLVDGTEFDSSYKRNEPTTFPLDRVIPCWTEGVQRMKVGGKATLVCPSNLAYGERGARPVIPGDATLIFEVELVGIEN